MSEREITITLKANNLTKPEFNRVSEDLKSLGEHAVSAGSAGSKMGPALSTALGVVGTAATVAAGVVAGLAAGIVKMGAEGAGIADIRGSFDTMNASIGNSPTVLTTLRNALKGTVSDVDIMKASNVGLSNGLKLNEQGFELTAKASRVLADRLGGDTKTAYETLIGAMATGQDKTLKGIGLDIDAEAALTKHAAALGKQKSELTEGEQETAKRNAILAAMKDVLAVSGEAELDFADYVDKGSTALKNARNEMMEGIATSPVLAAAIGPIGDALAGAFGDAKSTLIKKMVGWVESAATGMVWLGEKTLGMAEGMMRGLLGAEAKLAGFAASAKELAANLPGATEGMKASAVEARAYADSAARAAEGDNGLLKVITGLRQGFGDSLEAMKRAKEGQEQNVVVTTKHAQATAKVTEAVSASTAVSDKQAASLRRLADQYTGLKMAIQPVGPEIQHYSLELNSLILAQARALNLAQGLTEEGPLQARTLQQTAIETGRARQATEEWANAHGAVLMPALQAADTKAGELGANVRSALTGMISTGQQVATAINGTFAQMALGAKGFKEGMGEVWGSIKAGASKAFTDILGDFTNRLMSGMLGALRGQQGAFGQAFSGMFSGAGGSGGGGGVISSIFGGGGAAGAGAGAGGAGAAGAGGAGIAGAGAGGGGAAAGGGAGAGAAGTVVAGVAGGAAIVGAGYGMGQLGQQIFGGAGWQAGTFGAAGGAATGAMIGSVVPVIGTAVGAIVGGLVGMASGFIGVSKEVKISRQQVETFQVALRGTLTDQQRAEAGGEAWKETVIAVRDAYLATGRTAEEAEAMVLQMWKTDKPKEAEAAVRAIAAVMDEAAAKAAGVTEATEELTDAVEQTTDAAADLEDQMSAVQVADKTLAGVEALGASTDEVTIAQNRLQEAMSDVTVPGDPADALATIREATRGVIDQALLGEKQFERMADAIEAIPREINIEVNGEYNPPDINGASPGYNRGTKGMHGSYYVDFGDEAHVRTHGVEAILTPGDAPGFVRSYLERSGGLSLSPAASAAAPNVYVLVEVDAAGRTQSARAISEREYLRREMQQLLRSNAVAVPQSAVVGAL